jgi:hypothetical protein
MKITTQKKKNQDDPAKNMTMACKLSECSMGSSTAGQAQGAVVGSNKDQEGNK